MAFNSIPASRIVSVVPSAVGTGGTPLEMATMLITETASPNVLGARQFGSATEVGSFFGLTSDEYKFAERYFAGYTGAFRLPNTLWISAGREAQRPAILQSASVRSVDLDSIKQSGDLTIVINGDSKTVTVDLSAVTSFSEAATAVTTALTSDGATCSFVPTAQVFEIRTTTEGAGQTLSFGDGLIAELLRLREEDGALVENGTDSMNIDELMTYILNQTMNFSTITFLNELDLDKKKEVATWTSLRQSRFLTVIQDTSGAATTANNDASFGAWLRESDQDGTMAYYGNIEQIAALCGGIAAIDFKRTNGRRNIMFMSQPALQATVTTEQDYTALISNGYTFYGAFATANDRWQFQTNGEVAGQFKWADTYVNQIYLNSQLQLALMTMLNAYGFIPYNDTGKAYHRAAVTDPINEALNFGSIVPLIDATALSEQQKSVANAQAGRDVVPELLANGWALDIKTPDAQTRGNRGSFPFTLWYTDGGSVQSVNLASIAVL